MIIVIRGCIETIEKNLTLTGQESQQFAVRVFTGLRS
jgi:hypothetical protein